MSTNALARVLVNIASQLAWKGPNGKVMGHVVISRDKAEILFNEMEALMKLAQLGINDHAQK